jgi:hypothetical protein
MPIRLDYRIYEGTSAQDRELKADGRWEPEEAAAGEAAGD